MSPRRERHRVERFLKTVRRRARECYSCWIGRLSGHKDYHWRSYRFLTGATRGPALDQSFAPHPLGSRIPRSGRVALARGPAIAPDRKRRKSVQSSLTNPNFPGSSDKPALQARLLGWRPMSQIGQFPRHPAPSSIVVCPRPRHSRSPPTAAYPLIAAVAGRWHPLQEWALCHEHRRSTR
jgi:hypothetical protein